MKNYKYWAWALVVCLIMTFYTGYKHRQEETTMLKCLECIDWKKTGLFAAGVAFGTAGIKILSSKDAKKVYTNCTAAALRAKECVMKTVSTVQENAEDILADAKTINEERAEAEEAAKFDDVETEAEEAEQLERHLLKK